MRRVGTLLLVGLFVAWQGVGVGAQTPEARHVPEYGSAKDKKDVNDTMDLMLKAYKAKDMATLDKIFHQGLVYGHTSGETQSKAKVLAVAKERDTVDSVLTNRMTYVSGPVAMIRGVGNLTDDEQLKAEGSAQKRKGQIQQEKGKAKDTIENALDK